MSLEDVESQVSRSRWRDVIEALRGADVNLKSVVAESVDTEQMSIEGESLPIIFIQDEEPTIEAEWDDKSALWIKIEDE